MSSSTVDVLNPRRRDGGNLHEFGSEGGFVLFEECSRHLRPEDGYPGRLTDDAQPVLVVLSLLQQVLSPLAVLRAVAVMLREVRVALAGYLLAYVIDHDSSIRVVPSLSSKVTERLEASPRCVVVGDDAFGIEIPARCHAAAIDQHIDTVSDD